MLIIVYVEYFIFVLCLRRRTVIVFCTIVLHKYKINKDLGIVLEREMAHVKNVGYSKSGEFNRLLSFGDLNTVSLLAPVLQPTHHLVPPLIQCKSLQ